MRAPDTSITLAGVIMLILIAGCSAGSPRTEPGSTTTSAPSPSSPTSVPFDEGTATVSIGDVVYEFSLTNCRVETGYFGVDGSDGAASLTIRHASPPTRDPAEPSFSVFVVDDGARWEAPPAAITFESYQPDLGLARGTTIVTRRKVPNRLETPARFEVVCAGRE